jgi:hypothetical protein
MQANAGLEKLSDNFRQVTDNFPTTKKRIKPNKFIKNIYIYIEVVGSFLLVSTPVNPPPLIGGFGNHWILVTLSPYIPTTFYDNFHRQPEQR